MTAESLEWIESSLGTDYPWPGNFRELEQCVRNLLIRGTYEPAASPAPGPSAMTEDLASEVAEMKLDAETLLRRYTTLVYFRTGLGRRISFPGPADHPGQARVRDSANRHRRRAARRPLRNLNVRLADNSTYDTDL